MTTTVNRETNGQRQAHGGDTAPAAGSHLLDRAAVRFLLDHRLGRLLTDDPADGEPRVTPVHYVQGGDGDLLAHLPAGGGHAEAVRRGGRTLLSVRPADGILGGPPIDEDGLPTASAIWHVQAEVDAELLEDPADVTEVLRRQIANVLEPLPQRDKSDPLQRAANSALRELVGVRLRLRSIKARLRSTAGD